MRYLGPPTQRPRGRFWPSNIRQQLLVVLGIDQRAQGYVGVIDRSVNRSLGGMSGWVPIGNTASPAFRWNGYVNDALAATTATMGASRNLRGNPNVALPATAGPVVITTASPANAVMNTLAAMPPGFR